MASEHDVRPADARVTTAMVGSETPLVPVSWSDRDVLLYALGVGAGLGHPGDELHLTTENTGGVTLKVLPTFCTTLSTGHQPPAMAGLDQGRFLHAGQHIAIYAPLPANGAGFVRNRIEAVEDKGSGAIIHNATLLYADAAANIPLSKSSSSIFVRGAGGFGGPRQATAPVADPTGSPDVTVTFATRPEQALLYRLSGDRHRLHSDPAYALQWGFDQPILHGLCTLGIACRALSQAMAGNDPDRITALSARMSRPVLPGQSLTTEIWRTGTGANFRMVSEAGEAVLQTGKLVVTLQ